MTPKFIFIVPYRNREKQKDFFIEKMKYILEDIDSQDYLILFIHHVMKETLIEEL